MKTGIAYSLDPGGMAEIHIESSYCGFVADGAEYGTTVPNKIIISFHKIDVERLSQYFLKLSNDLKKIKELDYVAE